MTHDNRTQDPDDATAPLSGFGRKSDGGIYAVAVDESAEFSLALHYAARMAKASRGHLALIASVDQEDFQHWSTVESRIRKELRERTESFVWTIARRINDLNGLIPGIYIGEEDRNGWIVDVLSSDPRMRMLILASGTGSSGPGPLVSHFTGKGTNKLPVPVLIVPGHLDPAKLDSIT